MNTYTGPLILSLVAACSPAQPRFASGDQAQLRAEGFQSSNSEASGWSGGPAETARGVRADSRSSAAHSTQQASESGIPTQASREPNAAEAGSKLTLAEPEGTEADLKRTRDIRNAVMSDGSLSFAATNVKIQTVDGKITLSGQVKDARERSTVEALARRLASGSPVVNHIVVRN